VVYSQQHLLTRAHDVLPGERLSDIAERYHVPWQLLARINGIENPDNLTPGEQLKVVHGPFSAVVHKDQLTLMVQGCYAGQFTVIRGGDAATAEGTFEVREKVVDPTYYGRDGEIAAGDPANPLGRHWLRLSDSLAIHGTSVSDGSSVTADSRGGLRLSAQDAADVFDILSIGSRVTVRR
jgi:LysM repeat protein